MDNAKFNAQLDKIFNLKESVQPEVVSIVTPEDSVDTFRTCVKNRLRGLKNQDPQPHTQVGPGEPGKAFMETPGQAPYPNREEVTNKVGVHPTTQALLQALAGILNVPVETLNLSPAPMPTGETPVWLKQDRSHPNPNHVSHGSGMPKTSNDNIGEIRPVAGGFAFKNHNNPAFAELYAGNSVGKVKETNVQVDKGLPGQAVMDERENPISVGTIKSQVQNFGPEALGQIIAKLNPEMNKVDANGQPTSEYNQFVDAIKQDGLELVLKASAGAGGVKMAPTGGPAKPSTPAPAPDVAPKAPGEELASL